MDLSSQEEEIPMPISSSYAGPPAGHGHGHMIHHDQPLPQNHIISSSSSPQLIPSSNGPISMSTTTPTPTPDQDEHLPSNYNKKVVQVSIRYRECLKNHAAAMGGNATDGCGEFMPSGEEGTLEALKCSACNCHRNFHRKEVEGEHHLHHPNSCDCTNYHHHHYHHPHLNKMGRKVVLGPHINHKVMLGNSEALGYPTAAAAAAALISSRSSVPVPNQMIMPYNLAVPSDQSDEQEGGSGHQGFNVAIREPHHHQMVVKKRFRTKFTPEQKEKMLSFAEKVGWRIQKQEESVVQQFCQEIGVRRRVLKVWMHNNKHNLAKKNSSSNNNSDHHQAIL